VYISVYIIKTRKVKTSTFYLIFIMKVKKAFPNDAFYL